MTIKKFYFHLEFLFYHVREYFQNFLFKIWCPFDKEYLSIFRAITFAVVDCGFIVCCANEMSDSSEVRIDKIVKIISECKYGIHDISRTELDRETNLPRFNMPFEPGMFLGAPTGDRKECPKKGTVFIIIPGIDIAKIF